MVKSINRNLNERKLDCYNRDLILNEINEFLYLYLFKGNIETISDVEIENLFNLTQDDFTLIKVVYFLLSDELKDLIKILPILIRNLSHSTKKETKEYKGVIKGHIDWNNTIKQRLSKQFDDKSLFVCHPPSKFYDLEENQLLKFLLRKIIYLKREYLEFYNSDNIINIETDETDDWQIIIDTNFFISEKVLKKVYFDEITTIDTVTTKHLRKSYKNRNPLYHKVARAFILYEDLFILNNIDVLKDLLEKKIIQTFDDNKLYELYILFNLIKMLPENKELKLLYEDNDYVVESLIEDYIIRIYYQKTPSILKNDSKYLDILDNYQINKKVKSPDIIIEFEKDNDLFYRLIEVKNSDDSKYIRDSLYKVIGYYNDFKGENNSNFTDNYPVVLVMWSGIMLNDDYDPFNDEIIILNRLEFLNYLKKLIEF